MSSTMGKSIGLAEGIDNKAKAVIQTMEKTGMPFCCFTTYVKNRAVSGKLSSDLNLSKATKKSTRNL